MSTSSLSHYPLGPALSAKTRDRFDSIDLLRGVVMVIMALDHVRDYFSHASYTHPPIDPVDVGHTTPALFFTRWITHFCAPTFVFLAGTGAFLTRARGRSKGQLSWFLLSRGLWLVLLDCTLVWWGWNFNFDYSRLGPGVIWAIGWSMVLLSGLVFLPTSAVATIGIFIVAFHNLLDGKTATDVGLPGWLWGLLEGSSEFVLVPGGRYFGSLDLPTVVFSTSYKILAWTGVMSAGYGLGAIFLLERHQRRTQLVGLGFALTLAFVALRFTNEYGDLPQPPPPTDVTPEWAAATKPPGRPWEKFDDPMKTIMSFVNCWKYPPSLLYVLMTLGPGIIFLGIFDRPLGMLGQFFVTFGRVPLFYYLLHIPLIHAAMIGLDYWRYGHSWFENHGPFLMPDDVRNTLPADYGVDLPMVYLVWAGVVLVLFPICYAFARFKSQHRDWTWLSYL